MAINNTLAVIFAQQTRIISMVNTMDKRLDLVGVEVTELKTLVKQDGVGSSILEVENLEHTTDSVDAACTLAKLSTKAR